MKPTEAIAALGALAHEHRLTIFRLLVEQGPEGLPAGTIAEKVGLQPSSLTFHLQHLTRAGLLVPRRASRQIFYAADFAAMSSLVGYLTENCCSAGGASCSADCEPAVVQLATPADRPTVRSLLAEARLPVEDLELAANLSFWVVRSDSGRPVAAIGLERHGTIGLLRSLVVAPAQRRQGLARTLVDALEQHANDAGMAQLVLLTETAESFFRRLGYAVIDRDQAPSGVTSSAEFRTLCSATAVCMTKLLPASH